jgi:hypothetical protein
MKTSYLFFLFAAVASPAALIFSGCSKTDTTSAGDQVKAAATSVTNAVSDSWDNIKDYTYDRRVEFSASIDRMTVQLDNKTSDLKAKFAAAPDTASKDRASAMKDYDDARADLKAKLADLGNATADTWADAKDKVAQSWKHVQAAYDKVTSTDAS